MASPEQLEDFFSYLRFPTISADPAQAPAMRQCVEWLGQKLSRIGFSISIHEGEGPPLLLAKSAFSPKKKRS
jgi:acetylornithine deacetylase/succinyl-diaminopimelate desuccinylase-like protein